ncbi:MAG: NAD-dependent epimerase/dehydratase family protein [Actinomycetota bacterium]
MRILVIGGTEFVGRTFVEAGLAQGHELTLFHRGRTGRDLFPDAERLLGDRDGGLDALRGRRWDMVLDTCGYVPRLVRDAAEMLADATERYLFVSTTSVYADESHPGIDEGAALADPEPFADSEEVSEESYGPLKVLCERAAMDAFGAERTLIVRPGYIVGPYDPTDRFTAHLVRVWRGGTFLAPGPPDLAMQGIDVRDLASWMLACAPQQTTGVFNAVGPATSIADILDCARRESRSDAEPVWVDAAFLLEAGVADEIPMWHPRPDEAGAMRFDPARAIGAGLNLRPIAETIRDTLAWRTPLLHERPLVAGLTPQREKELLYAWASRIG